jgi:hypothetical protein
MSLSARAGLRRLCYRRASWEATSGGLWSDSSPGVGLVAEEGCGLADGETGRGRMARVGGSTRTIAHHELTALI